MNRDIPFPISGVLRNWPAHTSKRAITRSSARFGARFRLWRGFRGHYFFFTEQHAVRDIHNQRLLGGVVGQ